MTKIQDVHPTICHSMDVAVKILENAILFRQREIADMRQAISACQVVRSDEAQPHPEVAPEQLAALEGEMVEVAKELTDQRTRKIAQFRSANRDGHPPPGNGAI